MNRRDFIGSDRDLAAGKPEVHGTRLSVGFLLALLAEGWTQEQLLENYPQLTPEALRAVFAFAAETVREGEFYPVVGP